MLMYAPILWPHCKAGIGTINRTQAITLRQDAEMFILDDDPDHCRLYTKCFESVGFRVIFAMKFLDGLVKISQTDQSKILVFLVDFCLDCRKYNGVHFINECHKRGVKNAVYVLITAGEDELVYDYIRDWENTMRINNSYGKTETNGLPINALIFKPDMIVEKPVSLKKLRVTVEKLINKKSKHFLIT